MYVVDFVNGVPLQQYLCTDCAAKLNIQVESSNVNDIIKTLIDTLGGPVPKPVQDVKCPDCGMTYSKFKKVLRFGCAKDYELFNATSFLQQLHGTSQHTGKAPGDDVYVHEPEVEPEPKPKKDYVAIRVELQGQLDAAVKTEDYEQAAKLRDEINALPKE